MRIIFCYSRSYNWITIRVNWLNYQTSDWITWQWVWTSFCSNIARFWNILFISWCCSRCLLQQAWRGIYNICYIFQWYWMWSLWIRNGDGEKPVWLGQPQPFLAQPKLKKNWLRQFLALSINGPVKNGPAIMPVQQNWPSQILAAGPVLGFSSTLFKINH